jgi:hypothetical protein
MSFSSPLMTVLADGLEGEADGDAEAGLAARALVPGLHDAVARAGDGHPLPLGHEPAELDGGV